MRNAIIRFGALYVFNAAALLLLGLLLPSVRVGWHALWAAVVLTAAALLIKPALRAAFRKGVAKSAHERTKLGEKAVQYASVFAVELIVWIVTVLLSGVRVSGFFWGWVLPPVLLLIGWVVYDRLDDRFRAKAGQIYDATSAKITGRRPSRASAAPAPDSPATRAGREELADGLTPEQRRMLDDLG
ncbi:hypothetical protein JF531_05770 [Microbacterium esteraromaticum]|uniref:hypothetical protein n=1 Tax=Microbacterium esteraromaticum TaxID=57043 RepID=UPI001A8D46A7|nr:hypothetical protein [Microbacterium esteraromaticum]MBN8424026.1 hypothetical protein [Microbacterium esteraromaticum]